MIPILQRLEGMTVLVSVLRYPCYLALILFISSQFTGFWLIDAKARAVSI